MTHPSCTKHLKKKKNYERLEFLGNSILGAVLADLIFNLFPNDAEGNLSIIHSKMASTQGIVSAVQKIKIGNYLLIDAGEEKNGGRNNPRNIENCVEALIGAIYVDGGYDAAQLFIKRFWLDTLQKSNNLHIKDAKSRLQEICQKATQQIPEYIVTLQSGLAHTPIFEITCTVVFNGKILKVTEKGKSKKDAEQSSATAMMKVIHNQSIL